MSRRATVLAYHSVGECARSDDPNRLFVRSAAFAAQMEFLARYRRVIALKDINRMLPKGKPAVAITFDDGYRDVLQHAVPILEDYGFPATVFVPTKYIGDRNRWDPPYRCPLEIMSVDELREAEARGLAVESHGHAHRNLAHANEGIALDDISTSIAILSHLLGREVRYLAYPYGVSSETAQRAAAAAGLECAFTTNRLGTGPLDRARITVTPYDRLRVYRLKTAGYYCAMRYSRAGTRLTEPLRAVARRTRN